MGKTHLFQVERQWFAADDELWTGTLGGWPAGVAVCYELGFPEIARVLALRGARLLLAPAAFGAAQRAHLARRHGLTSARERLLPGRRQHGGAGPARRLPGDEPHRRPARHGDRRGR